MMFEVIDGWTDAEKTMMGKKKKSLNSREEDESDQERFELRFRGLKRELRPLEMRREVGWQEKREVEKEKRRRSHPNLALLLYLFGTTSVIALTTQNHVMPAYCFSSSTSMNEALRQNLSQDR